MLLWLRADLGVTRDGADRVAQWSDQSGRGNHTTQATGADQPLYVAGVVNGQPVIRFAAANTEFLRRTTYVDGDEAQPNAMLVVWNPGIANCVAVDSADINKRHFCFHTTVPRISFGAPTGLVGTTAQTNLWTAALGDLDGASSAVYVNNFSTAQATGNVGAHVMGGITIGAAVNLTLYVTGDIAEILILNAKLSATQRAQLRAYVNGRYAIGVT